MFWEGGRLKQRGCILTAGSDIGLTLITLSIASLWIVSLMYYYY